MEIQNNLSDNSLYQNTVLPNNLNNTNMVDEKYSEKCKNRKNLNTFLILKSKL